MTTDSSKLTKFEGHAVRQVGIEIPGAAGGLREALKIDPQEFRQGTTVYVVLECPVVKVRHEPIDGTDPGGDQRRVHIFGTSGAAIVDRELVEEALAEQKRRIESAKMAETGEGPLPFDGGAQHQADHGAGLHAAGLVPGCPPCDDEARAAEAEAAEATAPTPITGRKPRTKRAPKAEA